MAWVSGYSASCFSVYDSTVGLSTSTPYAFARERIALGSTYMGGVRHRVFPSFGQAEHAVGKFFFLFVGKMVVHNRVVFDV